MTLNGRASIRLAVFSDTHGHRKAMRDAVLNQGPFDLLCHLGDGVADGRAVAEEFGLPLQAVTGNEDFWEDFPERQTLVVKPWSFLLLHGHQTEINPFQPKEVWEHHLHQLAQTAGRAGARVLLFGHTHRAMLTELDSVVLCNPGEQHPGSTQPPTFAVLIVSPQTLEIRIMIRDGSETWRLQDSALFSAPD